MKTLFILLIGVLGLCSAYPRNNRIINGRDATPGEAPYMIQFQITGLASPFVWCGGALVSTTHIVSAAHCFTDDLMEQFVFIAIAGQHNWRINSGHEQTRNLRTVSNHPNYNGDFYGFDINLIQVESPFVLNQWVQTIALPPSNFRHVGDTLVYGWGSTHPSQSVVPDILQVTTKTILDPELCHEIFTGFWGSSPMHYTDMCTGPLDGSTDSCSGDSGGPLVQVNPSTGNLELVAVVAWGSSPCATPNFPSVNTRTSPFVDDFLNLN